MKSWLVKALSRDIFASFEGLLFIFASSSFRSCLTQRSIPPAPPPSATQRSSPRTMERGPCASQRYTYIYLYICINCILRIHCTHDMHATIGALWRVGREGARTRRPSAAPDRSRIRVRRPPTPHSPGSESNRRPGRNSVARTKAPGNGSAHPTHAKARPRHPIRSPRHRIAEARVRQTPYLPLIKR